MLIVVLTNFIIPESTLGAPLYCFITLIESCFGLIDGLDLIGFAVIVAGMYRPQARPSILFR